MALQLNGRTWTEVALATLVGAKTDSHYVCWAASELLGSRNPPTSTLGEAEINWYIPPCLTCSDPSGISRGETRKRQEPRYLLRPSRPALCFASTEKESHRGGVSWLTHIPHPEVSRTLFCHCHNEQLQFHELLLGRYILSPRKARWGHRPHSEHGCVQVIVCCHNI